MKVLVLGATGLIGTAVTKELLRAGHEVMGLCRSDWSARRLEHLGATPLPGDLRDPGPWAGVASDSDGIIQAAATFEEDMGPVDRHVLTALAQVAEAAETRPRFIYTGGCWLGDQRQDGGLSFGQNALSHLDPGCAQRRHSGRSATLHGAAVA